MEELNTCKDETIAKMAQYYLRPKLLVFYHCRINIEQYAMVTPANVNYLN